MLSFHFNGPGFPLGDTDIQGAFNGAVAKFAQSLAAGIEREMGVALDQEVGQAGQVSVVPRQEGERWTIGITSMASVGVEGFPPTEGAQNGPQARKPGVGYVGEDGALGQAQGPARGRSAATLGEATTQDRFAAMAEAAIEKCEGAAMDEAAAEFDRGLQ